MDEISGGNELNVRNIIDACKSGNFSAVRDFLDKDPSLSNCNWVLHPASICCQGRAYGYCRHITSVWRGCHCKVWTELARYSIAKSDRPGHPPYD